MPSQCCDFRRLTLNTSRDSDSLRAKRSEDRIPVGASFSAPFHTGSVAHPAFYTMGTGFLLGSKAAGAWR